MTLYLEVDGMGNGGDWLVGLGARQVGKRALGESAGAHRPASPLQLLVWGGWGWGRVVAREVGRGWERQEGVGWWGWGRGRSERGLSVKRWVLTDLPRPYRCWFGEGDGVGGGWWFRFEPLIALRGH
jgi:hypothetical protein